MGVDNTSSLVTQSGRLRCSSSKFPSVKIPRFISSRIPSSARRLQWRQRFSCWRVDVDLHTRTQTTLLPTSSERLSISPALLFTKDENIGGNNNRCNWKETKIVNENGVNYDGNMDRGVMTFTSDDLSQKTVNNYAGWTNYSWAIDKIINAPQC